MRGDEFLGAGFFALVTERCVKCGKVPKRSVVVGHVHSLDHVVSSSFCKSCYDGRRGSRCKYYDGGCRGAWKKSMGVKVRTDW